MIKSTRLALNAINREFYWSSANSFSDTRSKPWRGWRRVVELAPLAGLRGDSGDSGEGFSLLDIGCGNGRFGAFVVEARTRQSLPGATRIVGVDGSEALLALARERVSGPVHTDPRFIQHDIVADDPVLPVAAGDHHDLIALFGVMHHVPGREQRLALLSDAARRLAPGGMLALSTWQFGDRERFTKRIVPWDGPAARYGIDLSDLEAGDVALRWGTAEAIRYCHAVHRDESAVWEACEACPELELIDVFEEDGETADMNRYLVFRRKAA